MHTVPLALFSFSMLMQVTEHQKGTDGAKPTEAVQPEQQTAEQQQLLAGPAAGVVAVEPPEEEKYMCQKG